MYIEWVLGQVERGDTATKRQASAAEGKWTNRLGSIMELTVGDDHRIGGTYQTGVGVLDPGDKYNVTGFVEGDALSFSVDFGLLGSVASWTGHHVSDANGERLLTLWHLAQRVRDPHDESDTWRSLTAGSDEFVRLTD